MNKNKIKEWFEAQDQNTRIEYVKNMALRLVTEKRRYDKACKSADQHNGPYTGRGKGSTLYAKREKQAETYQQQLEMVKYIANLL